jgi:hypothetical protein
VLGTASLLPAGAVAAGRALPLPWLHPVTAAAAALLSGLLLVETVRGAVRLHADGLERALELKAEAKARAARRTGQRRDDVS